MRVAIYARVSTTNGQSPEMQLSDLREYASRCGWDVFAEYVDNGVSGAKESRPELNRLMADAHRRHFDVVLCWKVDRFGRSLKHLRAERRWGSPISGSASEGQQSRGYHSRIVAFSTGNVYPLRSVSEGGAVESTPVGPVGEYAQPALGRERIFENGSQRWGTRVAILRLNYAVELRYGVLVDIARAVFERRPISLAMPYVNVIWQRDANSWCLRSFAYCQSPPFVLNMTGPETLSVRELAIEFGQQFGIEPIFLPELEGSTSLLNNAAQAGTLFGHPTATPAEMIGWIADWIRQGGVMLNKPTHFQTRDGKF